MRGRKLMVAVMAALLVSGCCCPSPCAVEEPVVEATPEASAPAEKELDPAVKTEIDMAVRLSKKRIRGLQWEEASLTDALTYLRTITGVAFQVTPKVMEEKHEDIVITLAADDVAVNTVLSMITQQNGLRWELRGDQVWILTTEEIDGALRLRYYDIKDLIRPVGEHGYATADDAVDTIERTVFPKYWKRDDVGIEARNGILIARASLAVHDAIDRELEDERGKLKRPGLGDALRARFEKTRVNLSIKNQTVEDVIRTLRIQTGLNLMIDSRVRSDVGDVNVVSLEAKDLPLTTVLNMLATQAGDECIWVSKGNVALLTLPEFVN